MDLTIPARLQNYIGGILQNPRSNAFIHGINPATGEQFTEVPDSNATDIDLAVAAAAKAFPEWSRTSAEQRFRILNRIAELIDENLDGLAKAETIDNGKPLSLSKRMDIPRASSNFRFFATAALQFASESHENYGSSINYTLRKPIGLVGCISPWNLPLYLFTWKIAPALAAGNCVIAKPSEVTPVTAYLLSVICKEAGLPSGVLNIVHGTGPNCGEAIVKHPQIKAISFTGSTRAGERIASIAAPMFKKLSLELGGKNPTLIFGDCDFDKTVAAAVRSAFTNQGQICLCGSRILVEQNIYEKFKTRFVALVNDLKVGDPMDAETNQGALVSQMQFDKVAAAIATAKEEGGTILTGGNPVKLSGANQNGWFFEPTVIEGLGPDCKTNKEEIFGPVVSIQSFSSIEQAIRLANNCDYGLASSVWTGDINKAHRVASELEAGIVWINTWLERDLRTPFGGMKNSGVGREGGWEAMRFFTEAKNVCIKYE